MAEFYCIEQEWSESGFCRKRNALPVLQALKCGGSSFVHKTVNTPQAFFSSLDRWVEDRPMPPILYLFFHGEAGEVSVDETPISLTDIAKFISGRGEGSHVHFGACSTLNVAPGVLREFIRCSGASSVSGYTRDVCTTEASALEILFFEQLAKRGPSRTSAPKAFRTIDQIAPGLVDSLGFRVFPRNS